MSFTKTLTPFFKQLLSHILVGCLCLGSFPSIAVHPLDPHIQDHTIRLSLKGIPDRLDPKTEQLIFIQHLPKDASSHISLDTSLWSLPTGAKYLLMKEDRVILTAHKSAKDGLFIEALFKKVFLHPTEENTLTWGELMFNTRGDLILVQGKATKNLGVKAIQLSLGVDSDHPLNFRKGFFSKSDSLINHTQVSATHSSLEVQTKKFDNHGPIKAAYMILAFEKGINHSSGVLDSLETLTLAGRPGKPHHLGRFSSFHNKGLVRSEGLVRLEGKKLFQNPRGSFLAGVGILGHLETYFEQGSLRSPGFIRMLIRGSTCFESSGFVEGGKILVTSQENLFIKPDAQLTAREGILLISSASLFFEKGRRGGLEVFAHHSFPWNLFLDPVCKKSRHLIKDLQERVIVLKKKFAHLQEQLSDCRFGIHLHASKALMQGDIYCGNGSFSLVARDADVVSTIKGGTFTHSSINFDISRLTSSGSLEATNIHYQSFFARIKDELKTQKLTLSGGTFVLGKSIPVALLASSAQALMVEPGVAISFQDVEFQGGGLFLSQGSHFEAKSTRGTIPHLLVGGTCDTGESNITFGIMNLSPTGTLKGRGDLKTEIAFLNGVFGFSGNLEARSLTVIQDSFTIRSDQKIAAYKATLKPHVFINQGTFCAEDVLTEINQWKNTPQSKLHISYLHGEVLDFEGQGSSTFNRMTLQGNYFKLLSTSSTDVSEVASLKYRKAIEIAGISSIERSVLESPKTSVGGTYHGNSMDLSGQESVLFGSVSLESLRSLCTHTHFTGQSALKDLYIRGSNTTIGSHGVLEALTGTFLLSGKLAVQGKLSIAQISATLFQFLIDQNAVTLTPHGWFQSSHAHNNGTWTVDTLRLTLTHFYNYCRLQGSNALILKGCYLQNPGVIAASHIGLDYDRYGSFGTLASTTLGMRLDDRAITAQVLMVLDGISSRGTLELWTHNPVFITSSGHLKKSLTLIAPSMVFQAHPQACGEKFFSFFKRQTVYRPGFESLTSDSTLRLVSTKEGIRVSDFRIDAQILLLHSSLTLDVLGSHLIGKNYLETLSTQRTNIMKTNRPSLLHTQGSALPWNLPDDSFLKTDSGASDLTRLPGGQQIHALGIVSISGEKYLNHASSISSPGSVVLQATDGIFATPEITTHHESHTKKSFFGWKKKTTHRTWQTVIEPSLLSNDQLILFTSRGPVSLTGLQAIGTQNLYIGAQKDVEIHGTVTEASTQSSKSFGFGLKRSSTTTHSQASHPSIMASLDKLQVFSSQEGIFAEGVTFFAPTMEFFAKKKMVFTLPALTSSTSTKHQAFFVDPHIRRCYDMATSATPREALGRLFPLIEQIDSLRRAEDPLSALSRTTTSGITLVNTVQGFKDASNTSSFLGQQAGLLNNKGDLNTSVSIGWKTYHHKTTQTLPGEGGIWTNSAIFHSLEGDLLFDNAFGVNASKALIFDIRKGTLHTRGFASTLLSRHKNQSYSLSVDALSPTVISGGDFSLSGRKTTAKHWIPQTIHSPDVTFDVRAMVQENAFLDTQHLSGKIVNFQSITHLDTLEHDAWGISFGADRRGISHASCYTETQNSGYIGVISGIVSQTGSLEIGTFTTQGGKFSLGDTKLSCDKILAAPVLVYTYGNQSGVSYRRGHEVNSLGFEYHGSDYEALSFPEFSGNSLQEARNPFIPLPSGLSVLMDEKADYEVTIPLFTLQKEKTQIQPGKPSDSHAPSSFVAPKNPLLVSKVRKKQDECRIQTTQSLKTLSPATTITDRSIFPQGEHQSQTPVDNSYVFPSIYSDDRTHAEKLLDGDYSKILAAKRAGTWKDLHPLDKALHIGHDLGIASYGVIENSWNDSFGLLFDSDKSDPWSMPNDIVHLFVLRTSIPKLGTNIGMEFRGILSGKRFPRLPAYNPNSHTGPILDAVEVSPGQWILVGKQPLHRIQPRFNLKDYHVKSFEDGIGTLISLKNGRQLYQVVGNKSHVSGYFTNSCPTCPLQWIRDNAVKPEWNSAQYLREVSVQEPSVFAQGRAASQGTVERVFYNGRFYDIPTTGGGEQYLNLAQVRDGISTSFQETALNKTNWNILGLGSRTIPEFSPPVDIQDVTSPVLLEMMRRRVHPQPFVFSILKK